MQQVFATCGSISLHRLSHSLLTRIYISHMKIIRESQRALRVSEHSRPSKRPFHNLPLSSRDLLRMVTPFFKRLDWSIVCIYILCIYYKTFKITVPFTSLNFLSDNRESWGRCGLHTIWPISNRRSHMTRLFTRRNPQRVSHTNKHDNEKNTGDSWT